jgi:hypothetical protein
MFRKMRASLICGSSPAVVAFLLGLFFTASGQSCAPTDEIVSNNMQYCAGSGDTLWVASYRQGWGLNYTTNHGAAWGGYTLGCYPDAAMAGLVFGAGIVAAALNAPDDYAGRDGFSTVWHFTHAGLQAGAFTIAWPDSVRNDTSVTAQIRGSAYAAGKFYFACGHGGLLRWDPATDSLRGFLYGDTLSFVPSSFSRGQHPGFGTNSTAVLSTGRYTDSAVLVVTAPRLLLFDAVRQVWDTAIATAFADTAVHFGGFVAAFVNNAVMPSLIYAYVKHGAVSSLFRYHAAQRQWYMALSSQSLNAVAPAPRGYLYVLSGDNGVAVYRDTVSDTGAVVPGVLKPVETGQDFDARLLMGVSKPKFINDLVFLTTRDTTGSLCIASSEGLFVSWDETAGDSTVQGTFTQIRRARVIKNGLAETYALPGIITYDPAWSQTVFVYKLARDANVTIRIYDYNMQYVKSVIENVPRRAAAPLGRSTDSRSDVWDGTTASGRPVAPGVYYFKINASTGERSFGKIVVAKGRGN